MLNFGLAGVPLAWTLYGLLMGGLRRKFLSMGEEDSRLVFWPFIIEPLINLPNSDLDNILFSLIKGGMVIFLCTLFWSRRIR